MGLNLLPPDYFTQMYYLLDHVAFPNFDLSKPQVQYTGNKTQISFSVVYDRNQLFANPYIRIRGLGWIWNKLNCIQIAAYKKYRIDK